MSKNEMISLIETMNNYDDLATKAKAKADAIREAIKEEMVRQNTEELTAGAYIASNSKVSFRYFHYTPSKERQYSKSGERYIVSPYALQWNDGNYYLYVYVSEKKDFRTFRVDRMEKIAVLPEKREGKEAFDKVDLNEYQSAVFNMFVKPEKEYTVKLRCINSLADVIIDRFGKDVMLIPDGNDHFTVSVRIQATDPFFGWVCSFGRRMKILYPPAVVQEMDEFLKKITEMYKDEGKM